MDKMLYIAMTGASETLRSQAAVSHNLANVSTTGFREDYNQFRSMPVYGETLPSRAYAMSERPGVNFNAGSIQSTGRDLDMAINGDGWFVVQDANGNEAFTRRGDLRLTVNGILETGDGRPVLGSGGPIAIPPAESVEIAADGTISVRPLGQAAKALVQVDRVKLVNPPLDQLEKGEDGLFRVRDPKLRVEEDANVRLVAGALESSNVSAVDALTKMINLGRMFEMQIKVMKTAEQNDEAAAQMMRLA